MKRELLDYLICPLSFSELELFVLEERDIFGSNEIVTGLLQSEDNREIIYPVINGIPRILPNALQQHLFSIRTFYDKVPENLRNIIEKEIQNSERKLDARFEHTQKSFTSEWAAMNACSFAWGRDIRERREMFLTNFCINDYSELRNKKILDVGCGHGEVEIAIINSGAEIFAVDMCFSVDDVYARLLKASEPETRKVHVLQSNAHALPFKSHVFDLVHSAGVLHHTPDTL